MTKPGQKRIFVAGDRGMVGSSVKKQLEKDQENTVIVRSRTELDITDPSQLLQFLKDENINEIYLCAAKVGGIHANETYPAEFIYQNLAIETNVVHQAWQADVDRLLFLGSSCIYPKFADQPIKESALLSGTLEATNEPYAIAKIAGIKLCESYNRQYGTDYRSVMPTNLYGPNDNFHPQNSHVIPALMRRFHEAKSATNPTVTIWGTGAACREFLHVDDLARACVHIMDLSKDQLNAAVSPTQSHINIGTGKDISIRSLAETIANVVDYPGAIEFDASKPEGTPRKLLNVDTLHELGWQHQIELEQGLQMTYEWYCENEQSLREA